MSLFARLRLLAPVLLLVLFVDLPRATADKAANLKEFQAKVLSKISEDSIRPIREAMPSVKLPPRSEITNYLERNYASLPEAAQQSVLRKASDVGGDITKLDHYLFQEMLPTESLLRAQIAAQLPNDMFLPPKPGMQAVIDKALLVDVVARGVLALPRIQQLALLAALHKERGNTGATLRVALAGLGPGYVKLGQMLGNRPGLLSEDIRAEVAKLSSDATPAPYADVLDQIDKSLERNAEARAQRQVGKRLVDTMFAQIDEKPLGVGSLGQIHLATLRDGRRVVIKILKPSAGAALMRNIDTLSDLVAGREGAEGFKSIVDNFREISEAEIDYSQERAATMDMGPEMATIGITVPRIFTALSGSDVLVQELAVGAPITKAKLSDAERRLLAPRVMGAALYNVLFTGRFHGDLHEGNIFAGKNEAGQLRLTFIDWGMTMRISVRERLQFFGGLFAAAISSEGLLMRMYNVPGSKRPRAAALIKEEFAKPGSGFDRLQRGMTVMQSHGGKVPPNIIHAARTLMLADGVAGKLDPDLRPAALVGFIANQLRHAARTKRDRVVVWEAPIEAPAPSPPTPAPAPAKPEAAAEKFAAAPAPKAPAVLKRLGSNKPRANTASRMHRPARVKVPGGGPAGPRMKKLGTLKSPRTHR